MKQSPDQPKLSLVGGERVSTTKSSWSKAASTGKDEYDEFKFYTRATSRYGLSEKLQVRLEPEVFNRIALLINQRNADGTKIFPDYASPADFVRDAVYHWLERRNGQLDDPRIREQTEDVLRRMAFEVFTAQMKVDVENWRRIYEDSRQALTDLLRDEAWDQLQAYLTEAEGLADPCPEPYRSRMFELIKEFRGRIPKERQT